MIVVARVATAIAFIGAFGLLLASLPIDGLMEALRAWIAGLGFWAPLVYALVYGLAATLFIPGSALSLAAGLLFGVWLGTATVWLGAVIAIALSFLIARYAARAKVEAMATTRPRFAAIDRAIGDQGWKIVALMRLSPVFPFNLQNYLFGVTAIGFLPCWLASAVFIVPGTFLYVYLGYAGGEAAAVVGGANTDVLKLALNGIGLLATAVVTIVIARIAANAISKHAPDENLDTEKQDESPPAQPKPARAFALLAIGLACLGAGLYAYARSDAVRDALLPTESSLYDNDSSRRAVLGSTGGMHSLPPRPEANLR